MIDTVLRTVNFGSAKTGLSTVGYTLYDDTGTIIGARVTSGISEFGSTGVYFAKISLELTQDQLLVWDTGEGSPRYVVGKHDGDDGVARTEMARIRLIWNTLQNQSDIFLRIIESMRIFKDKNGKKRSDDVFMQMMKKLDMLVSRNQITMSQFEDVLSANLDRMKPVIPKVNIPDHKQEFVEINRGLARINTMLQMVPKTEQDYKADLKRMKDSLAVIINKLPVELKPLLGGTLMELKRSMLRSEKAFTGFETIKGDMAKVVEKMNIQQKQMDKMNDTIERTINQMSSAKLLMHIHEKLANGNFNKEDRMSLAGIGIKL